MFKDYCENITEKEYRESNRLSYSLIKAISELGPQAIVNPEKKSSDGLTFGYIVDKKLSEPDWDILSEFTLTDIKIDWTKDDHKTNILKLYKNSPESASAPMEVIYETLGIKRAPVLDDDFFVKKDMVINGERYLHQSDYEAALKCIETFQSHPYTAHIFNPSLDKEVINQAAIFFTINGVEIKSLLDKIIIDNDNKIIYPFDIKTGTEFNFMANFYRYKYYLQGALYSAAINSIVQTKPEFAGYKVDPFRFIYLSRQNTELPLIYTMSDKFVEKVMVGYTNKSGYDVRGIIDLVDDYKWYINNNEFTMRRDIVENNGEIIIDE